MCSALTKQCCISDVWGSCSRFFRGSHFRFTETRSERWGCAGLRNCFWTVRSRNLSVVCTYLWIVQSSSSPTWKQSRVWKFAGVQVESCAICVRTRFSTSTVCAQRSNFGTKHLLSKEMKCALVDVNSSRIMSSPDALIVQTS